MTQAEKEPKETLREVALRESARIESGKPPNVNTLTVVCGRLLEGERDGTAVGLVVQHGTVNMMAALHEVGLVSEDQWSDWKYRMTPSEAEIVLAWPDPWPCEVREWATVVAVQSL